MAIDEEIRMALLTEYEAIPSIEELDSISSLALDFDRSIVVKSVSIRATSGEQRKSFLKKLYTVSL